MATLTPYDAARASEIVYQVKGGVNDLTAALRLIPNLKESFDFESLTSFKSRTGAFFKVKSGFGFVVQGNGNQYGSETLVAIRGTASLADGLTDANIGLQISSTGKIVHAGFNRAFKDIEKHLENSITAGSTVHFCGHSLGGALATMAADWAVQKRGCNAKLYTFGSPRVGFKPFAERLTISLDSSNIHRVHRSTDVVPMVPIWPFVHAPQLGQTCRLSAEGYYSPLAAHGMANYSDSVKSAKWSSLVTPTQTLDEQVTSKDLFSLDRLNSLGSTALSLIAKAIAYILKASGIAIQGVLIVGVSVLDMLSMALEKAVKVSKEIAGWVKYLITKIASLTGLVLSKKTEFTAQFIRWIFQLMLSAVRRSLRLAFQIM